MCLHAAQGRCACGARVWHMANAEVAGALVIPSEPAVLAGHHDVLQVRGFQPPHVALYGEPAFLLCPRLSRAEPDCRAVARPRPWDLLRHRPQSVGPTAQGIKRQVAANRP